MNRFSPTHRPTDDCCADRSRCGGGKTSRPAGAKSATHELGKANGLSYPRRNDRIPGYSRWSEGVIAAPVFAAVEKTDRWPFVLVALLLVLALAGQVVFHFPQRDRHGTLPSHCAHGWRQRARHWAVICRCRAVELIPASKYRTCRMIRRTAICWYSTPRCAIARRTNKPILPRARADRHGTPPSPAACFARQYLSAKTPADQPFAANADPCPSNSGSKPKTLRPRATDSTFSIPDRRPRRTMHKQQGSRMRPPVVSTYLT